jgi:hypothetical protein
VLGKRPKHIRKGTKVAAAEAAAIATEAVAVADLAETERRAAEFEALGGGALTAEVAEASPKPPPPPCASAGSCASVSEDRSIDRAEILTARTDAYTEATEVAAAEAAAAEAVERNMRIYAPLKARY